MHLFDGIDVGRMIVREFEDVRIVLLLGGRGKGGGAGFSELEVCWRAVGRVKQMTYL